MTPKEKQPSDTAAVELVVKRDESWTVLRQRAQEALKAENNDLTAILAKYPVAVQKEAQQIIADAGLDPETLAKLRRAKIAVHLLNVDPSVSLAAVSAAQKEDGLGVGQPGGFELHYHAPPEAAAIEAALSDKGEK